MAILGVDDFKAKLRGGGARSNLFKATIYALADATIVSVSDANPLTLIPSSFNLTVTSA